jgi:hypothetical protein
MLIFMWIACTTSCPPGSSLQDDGLCLLDDTTRIDSDTGTDADTGETVVEEEGNCPEVTSVDVYEQYPVYIDGTDRRFVNIQDAIWGSEDGDSVVVCPGRYVELIDFKGKIITLRSLAGAEETTIDGGGMGSVVTIRNYEPAETVLEGFTITGGDAWAGAGADGHGGGLFVEWGNPTIRHNIVSDNEAMIAGGIYIRNGGAHVHNNIIADNRATEAGGGFVCTACYGEFQFNTLYHNTARAGPAAEWFWGVADMVGNIIVSDDVYKGEAALNYMKPRGIDFTASHNMIWPHDELVGSRMGDADAWPEGVVYLDQPQLQDPEGGDYHLSQGSPAVGAGPDASDLGAYGGPSGDWGG